MSQGKSLTLYGLFDEIDFIIIPILQRDYAQGRSEEFEVRNLFLQSIYQALVTEHDGALGALDLDFVYGSFEGDDAKTFSVLDGQQRLTSLFLLHWFLAVRNDRLNDFKERFTSKDGRSRFTYKTRPSTTEFFNALTSRDFKLTETKISRQIADGQWFYLSWHQDPTVQACLCMLDAIQEIFSRSTEDLYGRLTNTVTPYITFQFLDLHSFGLSDELYIKMNARGKPLTVFENFKAKFEQIILSFDMPWPDYELKSVEGKVSGHQYFINKIDTDWADLFWPYRNYCSRDDTFDDELMNFIRSIIAFRYILDHGNSNAKLENAKRELFSGAGSLSQLSLLKYEELGCLTQNVVIELMGTLDLIYNGGLVGNKIRPYLTEKYYYSEEENLIRIISNNSDYSDKLRFYAFYSYLSTLKNQVDIDEWMRVIYNLTENTVINTADDFFKALFGIESLCHSGVPILTALKNDQEISGFTGAQIVEEKIKAHLLLKSKIWRDAVLKLERHTFFRGQIGSILNFSLILEFYRNHTHCDWTAEQDVQFFEAFSKYANAASAVFGPIKDSSGAMDYLWERAVLSKGVYFTEKSSDRFNLLSTRQVKNNIDRDHSWRRLLRIGSREMEEKQRFVKAVFDDVAFDCMNVKQSLANICIEAQTSPIIEGWRNSLIQHPDLWRYCTQGFIVKNSEEIVLLSESQRNHYHSEFYTKALEHELKRLGIDRLSPLSSLRYIEVRSTDVTSQLSLSGSVVGNIKCKLSVMRFGSDFYFVFQAETGFTLTDAICTILDDQGFQNNDKNWLLSYSGKDERTWVRDLADKVLDFCAAIRGLGNE